MCQAVPVLITENVSGCSAIGPVDYTVTLACLRSGYGNDYLPWLYTQPLQPKEGC